MEMERKCEDETDEKQKSKMEVGDRETRKKEKEQKV
jgi:hypothetical protein